MKKIYFLLFLLNIIINISATDSIKLESYTLERAEYDKMTQSREKFFIEALVQKFDSTKAKKDSKSGLKFIDFCEFPPDRSLVFGPLNNGRFHGQKVNDLPFTCNNTSGCKKFFLKNVSIEQSYYIIRANFPQFLLRDKLPETNLSESFVLNGARNTQHYILQNLDSKRLWIIFSGPVARYTMIFTQKGSDVEVIMQYLNL